jgi:hypothetical protein
MQDVFPMITIERIDQRYRCIQVICEVEDVPGAGDKIKSEHLSQKEVVETD